MEVLVTLSLPVVPRVDSIRRALGDRYSLERELGRGGMGTVFLARLAELERWHRSRGD